jgi:peptide/nickel transport system permease protein
MVRYLLGRLGWAFVTLFIIATILFFLLHLTGDPVAFFVPPRATAEDIASYRAAHGYDQGLTVQYVRFLGDIFTGEFGRSLTFGRPALSIVAEFLPASIVLAVAATVFALLVGVPAGIISALRKGSKVDTALMTSALTGLSIPSFWLALMLILVFGVRLDVLPISGRGGPSHLILPAITIGLPMAGSTARLLRSNLIESMSQDYIRTARALGLPQRTIVLRHALKNASLPSLTAFGLEVALVLTGVFIVEVVFAYPGLGRLTINAIGQRDFPIVQAAIFVAGVAYVLLNLVVDLAYTYLDPRIRLAADQGAKGG